MRAWLSWVAGKLSSVRLGCSQRYTLSNPIGKMCFYNSAGAECSCQDFVMHVRQMTARLSRSTKLGCYVLVPVGTASTAGKAECLPLACYMCPARGLAVDQHLHCHTLLL
jgi:hypothetical protein